MVMKKFEIKIMMMIAKLCDILRLTGFYILKGKVDSIWIYLKKLLFKKL